MWVASWGSGCIWARSTTNWAPVPTVSCASLLPSSPLPNMAAAVSAAPTTTGIPRSTPSACAASLPSSPTTATEATTGGNSSDLSPSRWITASDLVS